MKSQLQAARLTSSQGGQEQGDANADRHSQISIDSQMIKGKQQIMHQYYQLLASTPAPTDQQKLGLIAKWPNQSLQSIMHNIDTIHKTNNAQYFGMASNEMFHGYGLLLYQQMQINHSRNSSYFTHNSTHKSDPTPKNNRNISAVVGRFYEGEFQNNCKHGYGLQYIAGDIYIGKFINNKPQDINGIFLWQNGDLYMGSFVNGMRHGKGRWESGTDYYEGTWKLNRPEGQGKIHTNTSDYEGDVKNGYKHGRGLEIFSNGDSYDGLYANGKPQGDGKYCWKNGAVYRGQFKNGIRYGFGQWSFGSQSYEGDYINDKKNGQGVYKWGGGSYYKGQFMDDLRHGYGEMHWNQTSFYKGQWREGIQSGQGQIWEEGKLASKGIFEEGKLIKQPNKLQKSHITQNSNNQGYSHKHGRVERNNKSEQKKSVPTRYPAIQRKERSRNNSHYHQNLSKIDQIPQGNHRKYVVSTSFSHNTKFSANTTMNQSFHPKRYNALKELQQQTGSHYVDKKKPFISQTPLKLAQSKQKHSQISQKKLSFNKKKIFAGNKTASKSVGMSEAAQVELEPIKWKNFTKMKNNTREASSQLPQL